MRADSANRLSGSVGERTSISSADSGSQTASAKQVLVSRQTVSRLVALTLLAFAVAAARSGALSADDDSEQIATTLYPGWSLIGWVGPEHPASDMYAAIPRLRQLLAFDSEEERWMSVPREDPSTKLHPGQALWLHLSPGQPFLWMRERGPFVNGTPLREGDNYVAWQGLDGVSAANALRQVRYEVDLAGVWDAATQQWRFASPAMPARLWSLAELNHGDAIWLRARKALNRALMCLVGQRGEQ